MKKCVSLFWDKFLQLSKEDFAIQSADLLELRVDKLTVQELQAFPFDVAKKFQKPILLTCRKKTEGGFFDDDESIREMLYRRAIENGIDYVDIEFDSIETSSHWIEKIPSKNVMLSHHTKEATLEYLQCKLNEMMKRKAAIYKIIFVASSVECAIKVKTMLDRAKQENIKLICHAMGEFGEISRIMGHVWGNEWTYLSLDKKQTTAAGQLSIEEWENTYHLSTKNSHPTLFGLLGYPVSQSKGKIFHNAKAQNYPNASNFLYVNFPTTNVRNFWNAWKPYLKGLSITIPYKRDIIPMLDELSVEVKALQTCNTAVLKNGKWIGYNTDVMAIQKCLELHIKPAQHWVVIGTGATAENSIYSLRSLGVKNISVLGRNKIAGEMLHKKYGIDFFTDEAAIKNEVNGIAQTTPVGMFPNAEQVPVGASLFRKGVIVFDVIYNPEETLFLKKAKEMGCHTISGVTMFRLQAERQFELFLPLWNNGKQ